MNYTYDTSKCALRGAEGTRTFVQAGLYPYAGEFVAMSFNLPSAEAIVLRLYVSVEKLQLVAVCKGIPLVSPARSFFSE